MRQHIRAASDRLMHITSRARTGLRRVMSPVAVVASLLFVVWLLVENSYAYRNYFVGRLFGVITFSVICFTLVYYSLKGLRWLKYHLLWRVRRRLVITYLFIGLTPLVLLTLLGFLSAAGGSSQAMSRIVAVQISATEKQSLTAARALAYALQRRLANADERSLQEWLDERTALLQAALPGARVAVWRMPTGEDVAALGHGEPAEITSSEPTDENMRGVGGDTTPVGAPLPTWLSGREEWSGFTYVPPAADSEEVFGSPAVRALVRGKSDKRSFALLLTIPVSRALVQQFRESTGIRIHPFFIGANVRTYEKNMQARQQNNAAKSAADGPNVQQGETEGSPGITISDDGQQHGSNITRDQFGDPIRGTPFVEMPYPMFVSATDWSTGKNSERPAFLVNWSWSEAGKQILGDKTTGQFWRKGLIGLGSAFLILELLALLSAAWMTRAVTGAVHKLYQATEYIKRGDFSHRVHIRSHDQLGELAAAFNDMSDNIESLLEERVERERLEREVEIAAEVQAQLFPRSVPHLSTTEIAGECRAARGVAGDYYDYIEVAPGLVAFALGDVSGKGISAALVMSNLQAALRAQTTIIAERLKLAERATAKVAVTATGGGELSAEFPCGVTAVDTSCAVANIAASINEQLCHSTDANRFATLFLALYDDRTRLLRYTNAGHNAAILVHADGTVERLVTGGTMVGAFDWATFEEAQTMLEANDLLLIFSDGISEAQNALGEEYGEERLAQFAVHHRERSADEIRHALYAEIDDWSGANERGDDQTLVIIKGRESP